MLLHFSRGYRGICSVYSYHCARGIRCSLLHSLRFSTCYALETRARRPEGRRGGGIAARARRAAAPVVFLDGLPRPGDQVLHLRLGEADVVPGVGQTLHAVLKEVVELYKKCLSRMKETFPI